MLKIEQCKPGVEVMAIINTPKDSFKSCKYPKGPLEKYKIYTIREASLQFPFNRYEEYDAIFLEELEKFNLIKGNSVPFAIFHFKLVDPRQLDQFYRLVQTPLNLPVKLLEEV